MTNLTKLRFDRMWRAQRGKCFWCNDDMLSSPQARRDSPDGATAEHFWPKSKGGSYGFPNFVLSHRKCNMARGDREPTLEEHYRFLRVVI